MPRLFTGLEVPAQLRTFLSLKQAGLPKVRWIEAEDFHLTLRFIGDVSPQQADDIVEALSARQWLTPTIELAELDCFGGERPTAIYASVRNNQPLNDLASAQDRLLQRLGFAPDSRRFTPHVTIGRCKGVSSQAVAHYLSMQGAAMPGQAFQPTRFVLYSARASRGGGPYKIEQTFPLNCPEAEFEEEYSYG